MTTANTTPQAKLRATLIASGLPCKEISCYGNQIVVTSYSHDAANNWSQLLGKFAWVRGTVQSYDDAAKGGYIKVWRTFAAVIPQKVAA